MTDLMTSRDKPCTKLVRSKSAFMNNLHKYLICLESDWTRGHDGYYTNGNKY